VDAGTRAGLSAEALAWPQSPPTADIATYCATAGSPTLYDGHLPSPPSYRQSSLMLIIGVNFSGTPRGREQLAGVGIVTPNQPYQSTEGNGELSCLLEELC